MEFLNNFNGYPVILGLLEDGKDLPITFISAEAIAEQGEYTDATTRATNLYHFELPNEPYHMPERVSRQSEPHPHVVLCVFLPPNGPKNEVILLSRLPIDLRTKQTDLRTSIMRSFKSWLFKVAFRRDLPGAQASEVRFMLIDRIFWRKLVKQIF